MLLQDLCFPHAGEPDSVAWNWSAQRQEMGRPKRNSHNFICRSSLLVLTSVVIPFIIAMESHRFDVTVVRREAGQGEQGSLLHNG